MEFHYDGGRENVSRIPLLLTAVLCCCLSFFVAYCMVNGIRVGGGRTAAVWMVMLLSGPVATAIYLSHLLRHLQYKSTRLVLESDALLIYRGQNEQRIERKDIDYVHHSGSMLEIRLRNRDPILLPAQFTNQEELLRQLS